MWRRSMARGDQFPAILKPLFIRARYPFRLAIAKKVKTVHTNCTANLRPLHLTSYNYGDKIKT